MLCITFVQNGKHLHLVYLLNKYYISNLLNSSIIYILLIITCSCLIKVIMKLRKKYGGMLICLFFSDQSYNCFKIQWFKTRLIKLNQITGKKINLKVFLLSGPHLFARGPHSIQKKTYSRAADLPFAGRGWPAGRSLLTPM